MRKLYYTLVGLLIVSCGSKSNDSDIFNGEIINIEDKNVVAKELEFKDITFKGPNAGFLSVYDSLAIYMNPNLPYHWYQIFSLNTLKEVKHFAMKGNGHNEFTPVGPLWNYYTEDNAIKTLIFEPNREKIHVWNITESLAENSTVIERHINIPWRKALRGARFKDFFVKDSKKLYAKVSACRITDNEVAWPYYQVWNLQSGEKTDEIHVFKKNIINKNTGYLPETFLYMCNAMKPDGSRIVQALMCVPQLNIIDTKTKTAVAYRLDNGIGLSDLETVEEVKTYFVGLCADDDYIYASFYGDTWILSGDNSIHRIYVFDWDGHLVSKVTTKHCIDEIAVDPVNKILYTTSPMDEKLYYIKTDELVGDVSSSVVSK